MPGWYEQLEREISEKRVQVIGLTQEQHPKRTELFNQWQDLEMTLLVDPLNSLDVKAVPIVLLVDQAGVIRRRNPSVEEVRDFLQMSPASNGRTVEEIKVPGQEWLTGDRAVLAGRLDDAIRYYQRELSQDAESARLHFRLGVAYRMKYDSPQGAPEDFSSAVRHWRRALQLDPNQYIWRRRIQQYGPVLDKPYPFYHWVQEARQAIRARGENPVRLFVEPRGAELVVPLGGTTVSDEAAKQPDPEGRIQRDDGSAVRIKATLVPGTDVKQRGLRLHLFFELNPSHGYAWNNEAEPVCLWLDAQNDLQLSSQLIELPLPSMAVSDERRAVDVDIRWKKDQPPTSVTGYVLYNVCEKKNGRCLLRRQDLEIPLK